MSSAIAHTDSKTRSTDLDHEIPNASETSETSEANDFERFRLDPLLTRGLEAAGFTEPRPIQVDTIPACMEGQDVMGLAQTGTGKTAAFALPILQRLIEEPGSGCSRSSPRSRPPRSSAASLPARRFARWAVTPRLSSDVPVACSTS